MLVAGAAECGIAGALSLGDGEGPGDEEAAAEGVALGLVFGVARGVTIARGAPVEIGVIDGNGVAVAATLPSCRCEKCAIKPPSSKPANMTTRIRGKIGIPPPLGGSSGARRRRREYSLTLDGEPSGNSVDEFLRKRGNVRAVILGEDGDGFFQERCVFTRVGYECPDGTPVSRFDSLELGARTFGNVVRRFAAIAKCAKDRRDERVQGAERHRFYSVAQDGSQVGVTHSRDVLFNRVGQRMCRYVPEVGHRLYRTPRWQAAPRNKAKNVGVIRVRVPLDLHAVACEGSTAFALATPLRIRDVVALAVREAIGARAPRDKFQRSMLRTLAGLKAGDFSVDVNGRHFTDAETVVVCEGTVDVRFFVGRGARAGFEFQQ